MMAIDQKETLSWLINKAIADSTGRLLVTGFPARVTYNIPQDSGKKNVISKLIAMAIRAEGDALLWINEYGIWPSCEDWNLFNGFRKSLGIHSTINDKPGHIFSENDSEYVGSLLALVLYFYWGAIIVSADSNLIIKISHDEYITIYAKNRDTLSEISAKFIDIMK